MGNTIQLAAMFVYVYYEDFFFKLNLIDGAATMERLEGNTQIRGGDLSLNLDQGVLSGGCHQPKEEEKNLPLSLPAFLEESLKEKFYQRLISKVAHNCRSLMVGHRGRCAHIKLWTPWMPTRILAGGWRWGNRKKALSGCPGLRTRQRNKAQRFLLELFAEWRFTGGELCIRPHLSFLPCSPFLGTHRGGDKGNSIL